MTQAELELLQEEHGRTIMHAERLRKALNHSLDNADNLKSVASDTASNLASMLTALELSAERL